MGLIDVIAKYHGNDIDEAETILDVYENEYFLAYPEKAKIYETSCTKAAKDAMKFFNIPLTEEGTFDTLEKHFAKKIDDCFKGNPNWYGIEGIYIKWHGNWADPEIEYKGHAMSDSTIEDYFWEVYKENCKEEGIEPDFEEGFGKFMQDREDDIKTLMLCDGCIEY